MEYIFTTKLEHIFYFLLQFQISRKDMKALLANL